MKQYAGGMEEDLGGAGLLPSRADGAVAEQFDHYM
jgi:hypothetical protein